MESKKKLTLRRKAFETNFGALVLGCSGPNGDTQLAAYLADRLAALLDARAAGSQAALASRKGLSNRNERLVGNSEPAEPLHHFVAV